MKHQLHFLISTFSLLFLAACQQPTETETQEKESRTQLEMVTSKGTMVLELYNETPYHRDNFTNLVRNKAYDSLLFHRVINEFMIQGGDPESKKAEAGASLGSGDAPYEVKAEIRPELFHKKGALAAARGDHPLKYSSAMQFYIVQGKIQSDSLLEAAETYTSQNLAADFFKDRPDKKALLDSAKSALYSGRRPLHRQLMDSILQLALQEENYQAYRMPDSFKQVYKTRGGYPRLDQNYTVFGEVIEGFEVIDSIAAVARDEANRPLEDVRIISVRIID